MFDFIHILSEVINFVLQWDVTRFLIPQVGVGGGTEAKEYVDVIPLIKFTLIFLVGLAVAFGLSIALTAKKFFVKTDPKVDEVNEVLAHAHCGACGYAGCEQYAEAVVNSPEVSPNLCTPGGATCATLVAQITNKAVTVLAPNYAYIMCQGGSNNSMYKFKYAGIRDCQAAILAGGGDKSCAYGCLGYGTCVRACPFGALSMGADGLPVVNTSLCTGCGKCKKVCPKEVIEVLPSTVKVMVLCHSKDKGGVTKKNCKVGCIGCGICVKICPVQAVKVENNLSKIDYEKCVACGLCATKCPTKAIIDLIPKRTKAFITEKCTGCQTCIKVCPVGAITGEPGKLYLVDTQKCIGCGLCTSKCPIFAIEGTYNFEEVIKKKKEKVVAV